MNTSIRTTLILTLLISLYACVGQPGKTDEQKERTTTKGVVGGPFENGEFMYIGMPETVQAVDTSAGWHLKGQKLLITGHVYKKDGKTPAAGVLLYYYQTDTKGVYVKKDGLNPKASRHGYIRGWVKSDTAGKYSIHTIRPAPYPNGQESAHIHVSVKEPTIEKEYYVDNLVFDDDRLLTTAQRKAMPNRGGSGVLRLLKKNDLHIAEHNIILGLNIPNYPQTESQKIQSGKNVGEDILSFTPYHAWGPDKDTKTCPVCKYGRYHGLLYFVGNRPDWVDIKNWLLFLEEESANRKQFLKCYFIYGSDLDFDVIRRKGQLEQLGKELGLKYVALTYVPSFSDTTSEIDFIGINPDVGNTILLYKNRTIIDKYINLKANPSNFRKLSQKLDESTNEFFRLPTAIEMH